MCPCSGAPSQEMPSLASSGKGIDKATLSFLVTAAEAAQAELDKRRRKEEEKEKDVAGHSALQEEVAEAMQRARLLLEQAAKRRKRKKRRKRRTPRTSSRSVRGRARRRQQQSHVCYAGFPGDDAPLAVFPSVVVIPEMLGIMACLDQIDSGAVIVVSCSDMCKASIAGFTARFVFPLLVGRSVWTRKTIMQFAGFAGDDALRAVLLFFVVRPKMLGIMAGMTQKDSCFEEYRKIVFFLRDDVICFRIQLFGSTVDTYLCQSTEACVWFRTAENCAKSAVAVHRWSSIFLSWCRGGFPWFCCSADPGDSTVAVLVRGDRRPCCAGRAGFHPDRGAEVFSHGPDCCRTIHRVSPVRGYVG